MKSKKPGSFHYQILKQNNGFNSLDRLNLRFQDSQVHTSFSDFQFFDAIILLLAIDGLSLAY